MKDVLPLHRYLIYGVVLALFCGVGIWMFFSSVVMHADDDVLSIHFHSPQADDSRATLVERGHIRSAENVKIRAGVGGVILHLADDNTAVKKGDELLLMDSSKAEKWYAEAQLRIDDLRRKKETIIAEKTVIETEEAQARSLKDMNLRLAQIRLELAESGLSARTQRLMAIEKELLAMDFQESSEERARQARLLAQHLASQSDYDTAHLRYLRVQASVEELRISQTLKGAGPQPEELLDMRLELERAQFIVDNDQAKRAQRIRAYENSLTVIATNIAVERKDMTISKAQIDGARVFAPSDGVCVRQGFYDWRNAGRWVQNTVGMNRNLSDVMVEIINPETMEIEVLISELDRSHIYSAQAVRISIPAVSSLAQAQMYAGVVTDIAGIGQDRKDASSLNDDIKNTGVTVYKTTIRLTTAVEKIRPGMSAVVHFIPRTHADMQLQKSVCYIPAAYVGVEAVETGAATQTHTQTQAQWQVLVVGGATVERRSVTGSMSGAEYFKVTAGVSEGEQIIPWVVAEPSHISSRLSTEHLQ